MAYSNYADLPQAVTGGSPWDRQSQDDIATGLHSVGQWLSTSPTPQHRESGSVGNQLPEWLVQYILEIVAAQPDTTPAQRDRLAEVLHGRYYPQTSHPTCNGQHPRAASGSASGCLGCHMKNASKSMLGSIRRTLSNAAKMGKRIRMPMRKNGAERQHTPPVALPRWSDPISPTGLDGIYQPDSNSCPVGLVQHPTFGAAELPSDALCELQGSDPGPLFGGSMPPVGMFTPSTTQPTHMPYPSPPSQNPYEGSHSGHSTFSGMVSDRSVSMMSDSSGAVRGTPSLVSSWSRSTMSSGLTAISTDLPRIDNDKDIVDSPGAIDETGAADLAPWDRETGVSRQVSWNSTSTAVDPALAGIEIALAPAQLLPPVSSSTLDTFPLPPDGFLDEPDGPTQAPPPYSAIEMHWGAEPPAYSSPPQAQMAHGFASAGDSLVYPDPSRPLPFPQAPAYPTLTHHSMSFPPACAVSQSWAQLPRQRIMPPLRRTTTYGAVTKQTSVAIRPNASVARGLPNLQMTREARAETFFQPSFQQVQQASPDLPSVRKAKAQRPTNLRRWNNQPGPRPRRPRPEPPRAQTPEPPCVQTPESIWCAACKYLAKAPDPEKKMGRHMKTNGHRKNTNQLPVEPQLCDHIGEDGVPCGKKYSRLDNLNKHRKSHQLTGGLLLEDAVLSEAAVLSEDEEDDNKLDGDDPGGLYGPPDLESLEDLVSLGEDEWDF